MLVRICWPLYCSFCSQLSFDVLLDLTWHIGKQARPRSYYLVLWLKKFNTDFNEVFETVVCAWCGFNTNWLGLPYGFNDPLWVNSCLRSRGSFCFVPLWIQLMGKLMLPCPQDLNLTCKRCRKLMSEEIYFYIALNFRGAKTESPMEIKSCHVKMTRNSAQDGFSLFCGWSGNIL